MNTGTYTFDSIKKPGLYILKVRTTDINRPEEESMFCVKL